MRRADDADHPGRGDGEALRAGWLAQPSSALSCLAYVAAGLGLRAHLRRRDGAVGPDADLYCALLVANGIGGVAFHGPGDRSARFLHDVALLGTLAATAANNAVAGRQDAVWAVPATAAATAVAGAALVVRPDSTNAASVGLGALAGATQVAAARRGRSDVGAAAGLARAGLLMVAATAVNVVTRTGAPRHRPDTRWQGHAAWHVLTAASMAQWGAATFRAPLPSLPAGRVSPRRPGAHAL